METVNADGTKSYTSGRINTQGRHDFKYGYFECRAKVPYGTIHYGEPYNQSQGTYTVDAKDNFADQYHNYACDWEPGNFTWYIDGVKYHEESDWFSAKSGQGEVTYPAPFDQPFYMILNLAVGGSWVGYPDESTTYDDQEFVSQSVQSGSL